MTKKRQTRYEREVIAHANAIKTIFPNGRGATMEAFVLYEELRKLEDRAHRQAERECNEPVPQHVSERVDRAILDALDDLLAFRAAKVPIFLNGDPRGYAIKIQDGAARTMAIHKDWGGYGIIAPEIER